MILKESLGGLKEQCEVDLMFQKEDEYGHVSWKNERRKKKGRRRGGIFA